MAYRKATAAGGIVVCHDSHGTLRLLILLDKHGNWGLPKGHLDEGEDEVTAAQREILEETGIHAHVGQLIERIAYPVEQGGTMQLKVVDYFLACAAYTPPTPALDEGISEVHWVSPEIAQQMISFAEIRMVVQKALVYLAHT